MEVHPGLIVPRESGLTRDEQWDRIQPIIDHILESGDDDFLLNRLVEISAVNPALNMQVNRLGEFEYWFAMIKVAAIIAFIIVGLSLILVVGSRSAIGFDNLTRHGGFLPAGWKGVWLSLTITVTSYMGVESIAVTAGEAQHPEVSIPHAMRNIVWRLILFYVLAIAIMVTMVPWNQTSSSSALSASLL
jgi:L-asparagine transporter-like permease